MTKIAKKTKFNIKQLTAIERLASDPGYKTKLLADDLKVAQETIRHWKNDINFISATYDRFMDVAGKYLPAVIMAQIKEAKLGSTRAAELVLKHFGKFQDVLTVKIESPFDRFIKDKPESVELVVEDAIEIGNSFEIPDNITIERDPSNDLPKTRVRRENAQIERIYNRRQYLENRNERHRWLQRAKKVNIKPLGRGRPAPEKIRAWRDSIVKAENEIASNSGNKKALK